MNTSLNNKRDIITIWWYWLEVTQLLSEVWDCLNDITQDSFNLILSKEKELRKLFWWKWYNILLLRELAKKWWFKVPHTEFITTDFHRKLFKVDIQEEQNFQKKRFDEFLNNINNNDKTKQKRKIYDFLKKDPQLIKVLLNDISVEELQNKYKILLDIYCDINDCDFESIKINEFVFKSYQIIDWEKIEFSSITIDSFLNEFKTTILLWLGFIREKTYDEFVSETKYWRLTYQDNSENETIDEYLEDKAYYYTSAIDLEEQAESFLNSWSEIVLSKQEEAYLKEIFDRFSNSKYLAIRSSADVEDGWKNNYPWIFYTWFCRASDFETFKSEIIKVLKSYKWKKVKAYQQQMWLSDNILMWIVIMDIPWDKYNDIWFDEPITDFVSWPVYLPERKEKWINEELYYPDWWWVITADNLSDDTFIRIKWVKWMPTTVTSDTNQAIIVDIRKWNWKILWYENQPWNYCYYIQTWVAWLNKKWKIKYHLEVIHENEDLPKWDIKQYMCYNELNEASDYTGCNFLSFSLEQYKRLSEIYSKLEQKYWSQLELEFVVHNNEVYIIQSRKVLSNFIKPNNIIKPQEEFINELILWKENIASSMWYINNEELDVCYFFSSVWADLYDKMDKMEEKSDWYFIVLDWFSWVLSIRKDRFSNLKCVVVKWFKWLWTHALMILREAWIPVISVNKETRLSVLRWKYKVYVNGSNWAMIYR